MGVGFMSNNKALLKDLKSKLDPKKTFSTILNNLFYDMLDKFKKKSCIA